jgi:hypothetical protein
MKKENAIYLGAGAVALAAIYYFSKKPVVAAVGNGLSAQEANNPVGASAESTITDYPAKYITIRDTAVLKRNPKPTGDYNTSISSRSLPSGTVIDVVSEGETMTSWSITKTLNIGNGEWINKDSAILYKGTGVSAILKKGVSNITTFGTDLTSFFRGITVGEMNHNGIFDKNKTNNEPFILQNQTPKEVNYVKNEPFQQMDYDYFANLLNPNRIPKDMSGYPPVVTVVPPEDPNFIPKNT